MYGGSAEIFENKAAEMPPPPLPTDEEPPAPEFDFQMNRNLRLRLLKEAELPPSVPPIPEEGLPQGWTMEQWAYYGEKWLEQNKDE